MLISVVIRTYNEDRYLARLLQGIQNQRLDTGDRCEVVLVDSGSTDRTLSIAKEFAAKIVTINKDDFTFGRSLNLGCREALGEVLVIVSGHCIPQNENWIAPLVTPLKEGKAVYSYGRQTGNASSHFSENQIFEKYFPAVSRIPQEGFFCNNANAALLKSVWKENPFDEELTGLEDMALARQLVQKGMQIAYVAEAAVYHLHHETWGQVKRRYEREAIALQHILPEIHVSFFDFFRYWISAIFHDCSVAIEKKELIRNFLKITVFRFCQFFGAYRGNHLHRKISKERKELYFYPRRPGHETTKISGAPAHESSQRASQGQELPRIGG